MERAQEFEVVLEQPHEHRLVLRGHLLDLLPGRRLRRQGRFLGRRHCRSVILGRGRRCGVGRSSLGRGHVDLDGHLPLRSAAPNSDRGDQAQAAQRCAWPMGRVVPAISAPP